MESVFKVGTYIVPLQNKLLSRDEPLTAYKPYMIIEYSHAPYILTDSGKCNFCDYYGKEEVERVEGIRWFATLKEAQTFCYQHIFEIGKYYSFNWDWMSEKSTVIAKVKEVGATDVIISWRNYLWIDGPSKYSKLDGYDFTQISQVRQLSLEEVQQYLPEGHPDKVKIPEIPEYIVVIKNRKAYNGELNFCYRRIKHVSISPLSFFFEDSKSIPLAECSWRPATDEEIRNYPGKPYDVTTIPREFILPEKWQIKVTPENMDMVANWRTSGWLSAKGYCVNKVKGCDHVGYWFPEKQENYTEITSEQFKKYVLKQENGEKDWTKATVEERLAEAKRRYPEGTKFKTATESSENIYTSDGNAISWTSDICPDTIANNPGQGLFYANGKWAEIVPEPEEVFHPSTEQKESFRLNVQEYRPLEPLKGEQIQAFCRDIFIPKKPKQNKEDEEFLNYLPEPD